VCSHIAFPDRGHLFLQATRLALSEAAAGLSASRKADIHLRLEACRHGHWDELFDAFPGDQRLLCVSQSLRPAESGVMLWLSGEAVARELMLHLLGEDLQLNVLTEMEEEALTEIGNRLINRCLERHARLAPAIHGALPPRLWRGGSEEIRARFPAPVAGDRATCADLSIEFDSRSLSSAMIWCGEAWQVPGTQSEGGSA
jgi:chemotaxis protein CheC